MSYGGKPVFLRQLGQVYSKWQQFELNKILGKTFQPDKGKKDAV